MSTTPEGAPTLPTLEELRQKLVEAKNGSTELDVMVYMLVEQPRGKYCWRYDEWWLDAEDFTGTPTLNRWLRVSAVAKKYTQSRDDAATLHSPGFDIDVHIRDKSVTVMWNDWHGYLANSEAPTEPLARTMAAVDYAMAQAAKTPEEKAS